MEKTMFPPVPYKKFLTMKTGWQLKYIYTAFEMQSELRWVLMKMQEKVSHKSTHGQDNGLAHTELTHLFNWYAKQDSNLRPTA